MYFMHNIVCIKSLYEKTSKFILKNDFIESINAFAMKAYESKWLIATMGNNLLQAIAEKLSIYCSSNRNY